MRLKRHSALMSGALVCALVLAGATPTFASSDPDADSVADAVSDAAPSDLTALPIEESRDQLTVSPNEGGEITAAVDPSEGLLFASKDGDHAATVGLPGADDLSDAAISEDGSITFAGDHATPSVNVMVADTAVRISTVISSPNQTEEFTYDFGDAAVVELQDDGGALVLSTETVADAQGEAEVILASIAAPWAVDAAGESLETRYVADGGTLTQVVEHHDVNVAYPVVADPSFDQPNIFQFRVRFNRAETRTIAQNGLASLGGAICGAPMALVCIVAAGSIAWNAGVAENSKPKRCVQVTGTNTYSPLNVVWWVDTYRGGPCR